MAANQKYAEYFEIDKNYFPCFDDSAINAGADWKNVYPHETFIKLLSNVERMMSRQTRRSIWIHGAYGTGKSICAYALKKILETSAEELKEYWNRYEPLKKYTDLLEKFLAAKKDKIISVHRYASGGINDYRDLLMAVQESVQKALQESGASYLGEETLKDVVIAWIEKPEQKDFLNKLLQKDEYQRRFSQRDADDVLKTLRTGESIKQLMDNIFYLAGKELSTSAFNMNTDELKKWLLDVIKKNNLKALVLIWDEFSDYFKNNRTSLSEFQKIVALCQEAPFYFIVVTHQTGSLINNADQSWKIIQDRFDFSEITLPDSIAFELITHALKIKPAAKTDWDSISGDLNSRLQESRSAVTQAVNLKNVDALKGIVPLHPFAAMLLKNIAVAFDSNQRSMFDFIKKPAGDDYQGFQWYIENHSPIDDRPLLTIDLLWDFFYEKGKQNLSTDIRAILDTYPSQKNLDNKESAVLKTILMMQAIDQRTGSDFDIFKTNEKNVRLAFEGVEDLERDAVGIAKRLVWDKILYNKPIGDGATIFATAAVLGDEQEIEHTKSKLRENIKTADLVAQGELQNAIVLATASLTDALSAASLTAALSLRYDITPVTTDNFTQKINELRNKSDNSSENWKFYACIAFAKDKAEQAVLHGKIKESAANKDYEKILFIDALSETFGDDDFENYIDFEARGQYWNQKDGKLADENRRRSVEVLEKWRERIANNRFIVQSYTHQEGDNYTNAQNALSALKTNVLGRFKHAFDFSQRTVNGAVKNISQAQLKPSNLKASAAAGIKQQTSGAVVNIEQALFPPGIWKTDNYWETQPTIPISIIKNRISKVIQESFEETGKISIREIYDALVNEFGFAPCNLSAFLAGFLLKEYALPPYRYADERGANEQMSTDKLGEMIGNYIKETITPNNRYTEVFIQKLSADEKAFFELTEKVFQIPQSQCSSPEDAYPKISAKMRELAYPLWCLSEIDSSGVYNVVQKYMELVRKEGKEAGNIVREIGRAANSRTDLADNLSALVTRDNCVKAMQEFLARFENGGLTSLAKEINAAAYLSDVRKKFEAKHSCRWEEELGKDEIRNLIVEYKIIHESNNILTESANSLQKCFDVWREHLKHVKVSQECSGLTPDVTKVLADIAERAEFFPTRLREFLDSLLKHGEQIKTFFETQFEIFQKVYAAYLDGLNDDDIKKIMAELPAGLFVLTKQECNKIVNEKADEAKRNQLKTKLMALWREKTSSKSPKEWSNHHRTPALCLIPDNYFEDAKAAFDALNRNNPTEREVKNALEFLEIAAFLDDLNDGQKRDIAFKRGIMDKFALMLPGADEVRDYLDSKLSLEPYEWYENPNIKKAIEEYAKSRYDAGGSEKALQKIDDLDIAKLKEYLKRLVKDNMTVGIEIILTEGDAL